MDEKERTINITGDEDGMKGAVDAFLSFEAARSRILALPFTSVSDYLSLLQHTARLVHSHCAPSDQEDIKEEEEEREGSAVFYLAAAVSDFYLERTPEHKIQSSAGSRTF